MCLASTLPHRTEIWVRAAGLRVCGVKDGNVWEGRRPNWKLLLASVLVGVSSLQNVELGEPLGIPEVVSPRPQKGSISFQASE